MRRESFWGWVLLALAVAFIVLTGVEQVTRTLGLAMASICAFVGTFILISDRLARRRP